MYSLKTNHVFQNNLCKRIQNHTPLSNPQNPFDALGNRRGRAGCVFIYDIVHASQSHINNATEKTYILYAHVSPSASVFDHGSLGN